MKKALPLLLCGLFVSAANAQLWSGANGDPSGWKHLNWLGWFWSSSEDAGWFYLENQGWAYTDADSTDSMFIYYEDWQWTWTSASIYPWSFNTNVEYGGIDWQYYSPGSSLPILYYSDGSQFWRTGPFDFLESLDYSSMSFETIEKFQKVGSLMLLQGDNTTFGLGDTKYTVEGGIGPFSVPELKTDSAALLTGTVLKGESKQFTLDINIPPTLTGKTVDLLILGRNVEWQAQNTKPIASAIFNLSKENDVLEIQGVGFMQGFDDYSAYAALPAFESFTAEAGGRKFNIYEGEFLLRGLVFFTPVLRYNPGNGEDIVLYGLSEPNSTQSSVQVSFHFSDPSPAPKGDIITQTGFLPTPDGFGFTNSFLETPVSDTTILDAEDMYMLMGKNYSTKTEVDGKATFTLTTQGNAWRQAHLKSMGSGRCFGMAVTGSRIFYKLPYRGMTIPSDYQPSATTAFEIQKQNALKAITFWMISQFNPNVKSAEKATEQNGPAWVLEQLIADMNGAQQISLLSIHNTDFSSGHAVMPYAITQISDDVFRIHIWDNNLPAYHTNFIEIDTTKNIWAYKSELQGQEWYTGKFAGDVSSKSLGFVTMQTLGLIANPPSGGNNPLPPLTITKLLPFSLSHILASEGSNKIGYDFSTQSYVKDWPDAELRPQLDSTLPPQISLPIMESALPNSLSDAFSESFKVELGPRDSSSSDLSTGLSVNGNTYTSIIDNVMLSSGETADVYSHPSGEFLGIDVSESGVSITPVITVGVQNNETLEGLFYEVTPKAALSRSGDVSSLYVVADLSEKSVKAYQKVGDNFVELTDSQVTITNLASE